jgi:hypothetical protein
MLGQRVETAREEKEGRKEKNRKKGQRGDWWLKKHRASAGTSECCNGMGIPIPSP